ncbi:YecA family protein [Clostridium perfringens]|uniref:YecA family protein n=1 Tax=Clostridium perfringens TaxID=1502 RepID=UPI0018980535|nr:SEC-C metal-binding domain-containing protein [Clostridium perfringens]
MNFKEIKEYLNNFSGDFLDEKIEGDLKRLKNVAVLNDNQDLAKEIWCIEQVYKVIKFYLSAFNNLHKKEYYKAWVDFDRSDIEFSFLRRHFEYDNKIYNLAFIERKIRDFQKLFPNYIFTSRETIVKSQHCSICKKKRTLRNSCEHKVGEIYNGEQCFNVIDEFDILGIAIVKNPFDKYAVAFIEGEEYNYDMLKCLCDYIKKPFQEWYINETYILKEEYKQLGRNDLCLCGSNKKYKNCCMKNGNDKHKHYEILYKEDLL